MADSPDILLVRFSAIGDLLLTTPLLRAIRKRHPSARITFVTREEMADTLRHNPRIDRLVTWRREDPLSSLASELREHPWTHRLDLHGSLRSRLLRQMVGGHWTGYSKHRVRRQLLITTRGKRGGDLGAVAERYFQAAADLDVSLDGGPAEFYTTSQAEREADAFLTSHGLGRQRRILAIAPGAAHFTKRWPPEYWSALIRRLRSTRDIVILGGPAERALGERLANEGGDAAASAAGLFSLVGSGALLRRAQTLVSGDTGLLHLATAVGVPVLGLYGPGIREFGFFPYRAPARVLEQQLNCRPCSSHGGPRCPEGHHRCLRDTTPGMVADALTEPIR